MGMSSYVIGIKDGGEQGKKYKEVWDACVVADIDVPDEVMEFFDYVYPSSANNTLVDIKEIEYGSDDSRTWIDVDISTLPKGVSKLRFINSW